MASNPSLHGKLKGEVEAVTDLFSWPPKSLRTVTSYEIKRHVFLEKKVKKVKVKPRQTLDIVDKIANQSYGFSSSLEVRELYHGLSAAPTERGAAGT